MTSEEFAKAITNIDKDFGKTDPETAHELADCLMANTLEDLGFAEGIKIFHNMKKYYA